MEVNLSFLLCFAVYLSAIFQVQAPGGAYVWRSDLTEVFLRYRFGGLIFGGAYTWRGLFSEFYGISERKQKTFLSDARQSEVVFFHFWTVFLPQFLDKSSL